MMMPVSVYIQVLCTGYFSLRQIGRRYTRNKELSIKEQNNLTTPDYLYAFEISSNNNNKG